MWFDSHCHVSASKFDQDRDAVLERAKQAGVDTLVAIGSGYGISGNAAAVALAERCANVFAAVANTMSPAVVTFAGAVCNMLSRTWVLRIAAVTFSPVVKVLGAVHAIRHPPYVQRFRVQGRLRFHRATNYGSQGRGG